MLSRSHVERMLRWKIQSAPSVDPSMHTMHQLRCCANTAQGTMPRLGGCLDCLCQWTTSKFAGNASTLERCHTHSYTPFIYCTTTFLGAESASGTQDILLEAQKVSLTSSSAGAWVGSSRVVVFFTPRSLLFFSFVTEPICGLSLLRRSACHYGDF